MPDFPNTGLDPRIDAAWSQAEANRFPLHEHLIAAVVMGSSAQNTKLAPGEGVYRPDYDIGGIVIPPSPYVLGLESWRGGANCWTWKGAFPDAELDVQVHTLEKFVHEVMRGSPNFVEWLWTRPEDTLVDSPAWAQLRAHRHLFLSKRLARKFLGFADGQLKRMNESGLAKFDAEHAYQQMVEELEAMGLAPERVLVEDVPFRIESSLSPAWVQARRDEIRSLIGRFRQMHEAREHVFAHPEQFTTARMGEKRKAMVEAVGFDAKNATHVVRLLRMCEEILTEGDLHLFRTHDAEELKAIKRGDWTLEDVRAERDRLVARVEAALLTTALPEEPDREAISALVEGLYREAYAPARPITRSPARAPTRR